MPDRYMAETVILLVAELTGEIARPVYIPVPLLLLNVTLPLALSKVTESFIHQLEQVWLAPEVI